MTRPTARLVPLILAFAVISACDRSPDEAEAEVVENEIQPKEEGVSVMREDVIEEVGAELTRRCAGVHR